MSVSWHRSNPLGSMFSLRAEVDMYPGGSARDFITVVPDTAARESRERIKSAMLNSGPCYPNKSATINLAPANIRKEGAGSYPGNE